MLKHTILWSLSFSFIGGTLILLMNRVISKLQLLENQLLSLGALLRDNEKADILLVRSGFKPATMVDLSCPTKASPIQMKRCIQYVEKFAQTLQNADLHFELQINYPKTPNDLTHFSYIAPNAQVLKKLIAANNYKNDRTRRLKVGKLLGYPDSAALAFSRGESIDIKRNLSRDTVSAAWIPFLEFRLSESWKDEKEYVLERMKAIKKLSPQLYKRISSKKIH